MFNVQKASIKTPAIVRTWAQNVRNAGGGFENNSLAIASSFVQAIQRKSYYNKIKYLLPMLGVGINAARVPLIDVLRVGAATNNNFVNADFSQSTGLQGTNLANLNTLVLPSMLGSSNNGGLGYWAATVNDNGTTFSVMGCKANADAQRFEISLRTALVQQLFFWGSVSFPATVSSVPSAGHYYGQRSASTSRVLYFNASSIATDATNNTPTNMSDYAIRVVGVSDSGTEKYNGGRCSLAYLTDGSLTSGEISDFHSTLRNYLIIPTGK